MPGIICGNFPPCEFFLFSLNNDIVDAAYHVPKTHKGTCVLTHTQEC